MAGIYIHIPFCKQACHYCDFYFSTSQKNKDVVIKYDDKTTITFKNDINELSIRWQGMWSENDGSSRKRILSCTFISPKKKFAKAIADLYEKLIL